MNISQKAIIVESRKCDTIPKNTPFRLKRAHRNSLACFCVHTTQKLSLHWQILRKSSCCYQSVYLSITIHIARKLQMKIASRVTERYKLSSNQQNKKKYTLTMETMIVGTTYGGKCRKVTLLAIYRPSIYNRVGTMYYWL